MSAASEPADEAATTGGGFCNIAGEWRGTAEVFGGDGRFLGNGVDRRYITTDLGSGRTRIELSFTGPFKFAGHYVIADHGRHRLYEGPLNQGFAERLGDHVVQADHFWTGVGLTQRFFLMMLPGGDRQLSLALLSRGERLAYYVVGENHRVRPCADDGAPIVPAFVDGASIDLGDDPGAGRGALLLHRPGRWTGRLALTDGALAATGEAPYEERVAVRDGRLQVEVVGGVLGEPCAMTLTSDGWTAWSGAGPLCGSYSLAGGRALSGHFHHMPSQLRWWRREVVSHDGTVKAIVHNLYRGQERVATQHGVVRFEPA